MAMKQYGGRQVNSRLRGRRKWTSSHMRTNAHLTGITLRSIRDAKCPAASPVICVCTAAPRCACMEWSSVYKPDITYVTNTVTRTKHRQGTEIELG